MWSSSLAITRESRMISGLVPTIVMIFMRRISDLFCYGVGSRPIENLIGPQQRNKRHVANICDVVGPARNSLHHDGRFRRGSHLMLLSGQHMPEPKERFTMNNQELLGL